MSGNSSTAGIQILITEAEVWKDRHRRAGRQIEALACWIRIKALKDALRTVEASHPPEAA